MKKVVIILSAILLIGGAIFLLKKDKEFIATKDAQKTFGEGANVAAEFIPLIDWGKRETLKQIVKKEDFVVKSEISFEDTEFLQTGNILVLSGGKLVFKNSAVKMTPPNRFEKSVIEVKGNGEVIFESSTLKPGIQDPSKLDVWLYDEARFVFKNSQGINTIYARDKSNVEIADSIWAFYMPSFRAGGVNVNDSASIVIENSVIGGLTLNLPENAEASIRNFKPKKFDELDFVKEFAIKEADFSVILKDSEVLGDYLEGSSERGLSIEAPVNIKSLEISDSVISHFGFRSNDAELKFSDLSLDKQINFLYENINISKSRVMAEWGFLINGGNLNISNSKNVSITASGDSNISMENSVLDGFSARNFVGSLEFENILWKNSADISNMSNFTIRGSVSFQGFDGEDFYPLILSNVAAAKREFPLEVLSAEGAETDVSKVEVKVFNKNSNLIYETFTDDKGRANFTVEFNETNFRDKFLLKIEKGKSEKTYPINFITPTPVKLILE